MLEHFLVLMQKDLRLELRTRDVLYTMTVFSVIVVIVFSFAFLSDPVKAQDYGPGIVWVTLLFSSSVATNRLFDRERENGCLWALLLSPTNAAVIFLAKACWHFIFTSVVSCLSLLLIVLFFDLHLFSIVNFILSIILGMVGMSFIGTLFAAMLMNTRMKEVLLPLVSFPLLVPIVIAGVKVTALSIGAAIEDDASAWLRFMLGFDMLYGVATLLLFGRMIRS